MTKLEYNWAKELKYSEPREEDILYAIIGYGPNPEGFICNGIIATTIKLETANKIVDKINSLNSEFKVKTVSYNEDELYLIHESLCNTSKIFN